jgi:tetratricopeptide (TPR) repeat protein
MAVGGVDSSAVFSAGIVSSAQMDAMQQRALVNGMDLMSNNDYEKAIRAFQRAVGYSPNSANAVKAYQFMAQAYSNLNDSQGTIKSYQQALKIDPTNSDVYGALGNVYYFNQNYTDALKQYQAAVQYNPNAANRYSLGQGYLATGDYNKAQEQFNLVDQLSPGKPQGQYGLGLTYEKQGDYRSAINAFQNAIALQGNYYEAYSELGVVQANSGNMAQAKSIADFLSSKNTSLSVQLSQYIASKTPAKITAAGSENFATVFGPNTPVYFLDGHLASPDSSHTFSMRFFFSKPMDSTSVQNAMNWTISRETSGGVGTAYNFGQPVSATDATLAPHPISVYYDESTQSATVFFNVNQNADASATIDPGHILFTFNGKDSDGLTVDSKANQYSGFTGIA